MNVAKIYFNTFIFALACLLGLYSFPSAAIMKKLFVHLGYYQLLVLFLMWLVSLYEQCKATGFSLRQFIRQSYQPILFCILVTMIVYVSVEGRFRVLSDESNFMSLSRSMLYEKKLDFATEGSFHYMNYHPEGSRIIDKRPMFASFLFHLGHTLWGYSPFNGFRVNAIVLFVLLLFVQQWFAKCRGLFWGYLAVVALVCQPALTLSARSAGIDVVNILWLFLSFHSLYLYLRNPSEHGLKWLWVNMLVLAHCRYESALIMLVTLVCLKLGKKINFNNFFNSTRLSATAFVILPLIWQRLLTSQDKELPQSSIAKAFSFDYFYQHSTSFFKLMLSHDLSRPWAPILFWVAVAAGIYAIAVRIQKKSFNFFGADLFKIICAVNIMALWVVITSYYFGILDHAASVRLYLPFLCLFSLTTVLFLYELFARQWMSKVLAATLIMAGFFYYHPISVIDIYSKRLEVPRELSTLSSFFSGFETKNIFIITKKPRLYGMYEWGACSFGRANRRPRRDILARYKQHWYQKMFVVQDIDIKSGKASSDTTLHRDYKLSTVYETKINKDRFLRVSQVVN